MTPSIFTLLGVRSHRPSLECHHCRQRPCPHDTLSPHSPLPQPLLTSILLPLCVDLPILGVSHKWDCLLGAGLLHSASRPQGSPMNLSRCQNLLPSVVWMYRPLLIHPSLQGHRGCSHVLAVMCRAAVIVSLQRLQSLLLILLVVYLDMELLDRMAIPC